MIYTDIVVTQRHLVDISECFQETQEPVVMCHAFIDPQSTCPSVLLRSRSDSRFPLCTIDSRRLKADAGTSLRSCSKSPYPRHNGFPFLLCFIHLAQIIGSDGRLSNECIRH